MGWGGSLKSTWPVILEMVSTVPFIGELQEALSQAKRDLLSARISSFSTGSPSLLSIYFTTSPGGMLNLPATFTEKTFPGSSVLATTLSASTLSPFFTTTSPGRGNTLDFLIVVFSATLNPGVYAWVIKSKVQGFKSSIRLRQKKFKSWGRPRGR